MSKIFASVFTSSFLSSIFFLLFLNPHAQAGQIVAQHSSRCLDVAGAAAHDGANVLQWDCVNVENQHFDLIEDSEGYFSIRARHSAKCLEVPGFSLDSDQGLTQHTCTGRANQKWAVIASGAGVRLQNKFSGLCADVRAYEPGNGGVLTQFTCHGDTNQTFLVYDDDELRELARRHAPIIRFHRGERFFPDSIESFAAHTHIECRGVVLSTNLLNAKKLPGSPDECFIESREKLSGPYDTKPYFYGQDVRQSTPPIYASAYASRFGVIHIQYAIFFPYNQGKAVCFTLAPGGYCLTPRQSMGNHLGDWESLTVQIESGVVTQLRLGAHGKRRNISADRLRWNGNHPIIYAAQGSHGLYEGEGSHVYEKLPTGDQLIDVTNDGPEWRSWESMEFIHGQEGWMNYRGRFGNKRQGKNACQLTPLSVLDALGKAWNPIGGFFGIPLESTEAICQRLGLNDNYQLDNGPWWQSYDQDRYDF